ncbi:MAG: hypothetical protein ABIN01_16000 [Ferruginibacter sp.]
MWTKINDCGKQLTVHSKIREENEGQFKVYDIIEIEFDQYKVELILKENVQEVEKIHQVFSCEQLVQYNFEVEEDETQ